MSGTFRRAGSTKFGNDRKWGNFPGISAKWIISDEPFMESTQGWLSMLALRPSWGRSGNQPKYEYMHFSKYASNGNYIDTPALKPTNVRLSDLRWEKSTSYNGGLDIGFFEDRLVFDANYYYRKIDDLLFENVTLPSTSGFGSLSYQNVGSMSNQGWELSIYGRIRRK